MITKLLQNKIFWYILLRYLAYGFQFIGTLIIAFKCGPVGYGLWAYILIIFQFFNFLNFGIPNSLNNLISINKHHDKYINYALTSGFLLLGINIIFSGFLLGLFQWYGILDWNNNNLNKYIFYFLAIISLVYCNNLFLNVYRIFNKLFAINIYQLFLPLSLFVVAVSFPAEKMVVWLIRAYFFSNLISFLVFLLFFPKNFHFKLGWSVIKKMVSKALKLFVYNTSFYFIFLSVRYIISNYYTQDIFGQFSFALTISMVLVLILDSFSFLIFPKLINKYSKMSKDGIQFFEDIRLDYVTISHLLLHGAIMMYGVLVFYFKEYASTFHLFVVLCMAHATFALGYGYAILLMSKEKDRLLALISMIGLLINIVVAISFVYLELPFSFSGISIWIAYLTMVVLLNYQTNILLHGSSFLESVVRLLSPNFSVPIIVALTMVFLQIEPIYFFISFLIFVSFNLNRFKSLIIRAKEIIYNPSLIDLK